ncbi:MAG TPA: MurT ligase domain-containing protein [Ktedonobacterales bacterium]|nr:MurT ligase domain-containing protein [Ktedonobacterales bacterium]
MSAHQPQTGDTTGTDTEQAAAGRATAEPAGSVSGSTPTVARAALAVVAGRAAGALSRRLHRGGGTSLPGLVAQRIYPDVIAHLAAQLRHGAVVITGTNGKTTTSGMTAGALRAAGRRVWRNREGANLLRGIAAALIIRAQPSGRLRWDGDAAAVFEVDEAAFPAVVAVVRPRVVAVTNLFRDQLDRYGEVDTVAERWHTTLRDLPATTTLVLNADDPAVAALAEGFAGHVLYYGVENTAQDGGADSADGAGEVVDTRTCPRCGGVLAFAPRFYSHIGHWSCPDCGEARPAPAVAAREVRLERLERACFTLVTPEGDARPITISLPGLYNVYNALAAATIGQAMGAGVEAIVESLSHFSAAFGRAERIAAGDRTVQLLLAKNPTGLNEVLRALAAVPGPLHLLLALNDRAADGEDVSWIWDAEVERAAGFAAQVTVSGTRAFDLALRLKYAGIAPARVESDPAAALEAALVATPPGETLYVVPTYTAMLAVRAELERRGHTPHYWEQRDAGA